MGEFFDGLGQGSSTRFGSTVVSVGFPVVVFTLSGICDKDSDFVVETDPEGEGDGALTSLDVDGDEQPRDILVPFDLGKTVFSQPGF